MQRLKTIVPWETFRPILARIHEKPRKSQAGRQPIDEVLLFKMLVLQKLYTVSDEELEYQVNDRLAQDESQIGRNTKTTRVISVKGVNPIAKVDWPQEAFWRCGVVEPLSGWHRSQTYAHLNQVNFQQFLDHLSETLGDTVAVMHLDRALAHWAKAIQWPENLVPWFQPPHCPRTQPECRRSLPKGTLLATSQSAVEWGKISPPSTP
ncbi:MAG: hypothetical protein HC929_18675 [Leptolyngbyaceae cyanobacterium SM2_5_2]|nr:hypothetical protein [Leptolyngbyaceae cyanobacterium SM2_5_2]